VTYSPAVPFARRGVELGVGAAHDALPRKWCCGSQCWGRGPLRITLQGLAQAKFKAALSAEPAPAPAPRRVHDLPERVACDAALTSDSAPEQNSRLTGRGSRHASRGQRRQKKILARSEGPAVSHTSSMQITRLKSADTHVNPSKRSTRNISRRLSETQREQHRHSGCQTLDGEPGAPQKVNSRRFLLRTY
jgi:hypothetical protein